MSLETSTQSQVFELLGRAVYLCNVIELRLRWMHKHCGGIWTGKTPQELLESLKKAIEKQKGDKSPLGPIGVEMLEAIYTPRCNKELENAEKQGLFAFKFDYKIEWKGRLRHAKTKFKNFVDVRNTLVHYVARDYDLATPETCQILPRLIKSPYKMYSLNIPYFIRVRKRFDAEKIRKIG